MYEVPDAVPPIHAVSSHVATDMDPSKFRSIFSDNLQPIATRGKKARGTLLVDIGCSSKRVPLSVNTTTLAAAILVVAVVRRRGSAGPVLPLCLYHCQSPRIPCDDVSFTTSNTNNDNVLGF